MVYLLPGSRALWEGGQGETTAGLQLLPHRWDELWVVLQVASRMTGFVA